MRFTDKVCLVTGGASGIGRETCKRFAAEGGIVVVVDINEAGGNQTVNMITETERQAIFIKADVSDATDVRATVNTVVSRFGRIDILVNNAGSLVERLRTLELTEARWDEVMNLNATSAFFAAKAVIPKMLEKGGGAIINVTSIAGRNGGAPGSIHYSSAKAALLTMTKGLAKEFANRGIRVNAVSPGVIDTPYHVTFTTAETMQNLRNTIPMGREGRPEEVAAVIAFLASDAASYLCGETIEINGGLLMD